MLTAVAVSAVVGSAAVTAVLAPLITDVVLATRWPGRFGLRTVGSWLTSWHAWRLNQLFKKREKARTISDHRRRTAVLTVVLGKMQRYPRHSTENDLITATRTGNVLRAALYRARVWSGLELSTCWPVLVAVLPDTARSAISNAATSVLVRAQLLLFAVATAAWWPLLGWRWAPVSVTGTTLLTVAVLRGITAAVANYSDEMETVVRAHRFALYSAVGLDRPKDSANEVIRGEALAELLQGTNKHLVKYAQP